MGADVEAPAEDVWKLITRFERWPDWGTTVRGVEADAEAVRPGLTGRVHTAVGIWLPFEITDVVDGRSWSWAVAGRPATRHFVTPLSPARCRVEFTVAWPLAPYGLMMWLALRRIQRLAIGASAA